MDQITKGIWEICFVLESCPVSSDSFWDISRVLMNRRQIRVSIRKRRINMDGPLIALESSSNVLHFFEGVAHVAVGVCKRWLNSGQVKFQELKFRLRARKKSSVPDSFI